MDRRSYEYDLAQVATVNEVAELWSVHRDTVRKWIALDRIVAVQRMPRSTWLVSLRSVIAYAGPPVGSSWFADDKTPIARIG